MFVYVESISVFECDNDNDQKYSINIVHRLVYPIIIVQMIFIIKPIETLLMTLQ